MVIPRIQFGADVFTISGRHNQQKILKTLVGSAIESKAQYNPEDTFSRITTTNTTPKEDDQLEFDLIDNGIDAAAISRASKQNP